MHGFNLDSPLRLGNLTAIVNEHFDTSFKTDFSASEYSALLPGDGAPGTSPFSRHVNRIDTLIVRPLAREAMDTSATLGRLEKLATMFLEQQFTVRRDGADAFFAPGFEASLRRSTATNAPSRIEIVQFRLDPYGLAWTAPILDQWFASDWPGGWEGAEIEIYSALGLECEHRVTRISARLLPFGVKLSDHGRLALSYRGLDFMVFDQWYQSQGVQTEIRARSRVSESPFSTLDALLGELVSNGLIFDVDSMQERHR
jgi:hypothetical protein